MSKVTVKGQVLIPKELRQRFGIEVGKTDVVWVVDHGQLCLKVNKKRRVSRFAKVAGTAKGRGLGLTTDQIMEITRGED